MTYKLRFLYAAKAAHPAGAVFATLRLADFCLALTASQTLIRGSLIKKTILSAITEVRSSDLQRSSSLYRAPRTMRSWYCDERLTAMASHEARSHMETDLHRYLFVSSYGQALGISPKLADFPTDLLLAHRNVKDGGKADCVKTITLSDISLKTGSKSSFTLCKLRFFAFFASSRFRS